MGLDDNIAGQELADGGCLDDLMLVAFVEGSLDEERLASVDAHLDSCVSCRELVSAVAHTHADESARDPVSLTRGDPLGRYIVEEPLGQGAMGVVYLARDPQLEREVALKVMRNAGDPRRLAREGQAMAKLKHEHVITVYDVGALTLPSGEDALFIAMELAPSGTLREWLAEPRDEEAILKRFLEAGAGLRAAHDAGLVHRDFKPDNVLLDAGGRAKVTDFGLAGLTRDGAASSRAESPSPSDDRGELSLTRTGALLGTPAYMAPEQLDGARATQASDQFAFAVALAEALTGSRPFAGTTLPALRDAISAGPLLGALPRRLRAPLARALSEDPRARFPTLSELLDAISPRPSRRGTIGLVAIAVAVALVAIALTSRDAEQDRCASLAEPSERFSSARARLAETVNVGLSPLVLTPLDAYAERVSTARVAACRAGERGERSDELTDRRMACLDDRRDAMETTARSLASLETNALGSALGSLETLPSIAVCEDDEWLAESFVLPMRGAEEVREVQARADELAVRLMTRAPTSRDDEEQRALAAQAALLAFPPLTATVSRLEAELALARADFPKAERAVMDALLVATSIGDEEGVARGWLDRVRIAGERGRHDEASEHLRHAEAAITNLGNPRGLSASLKNRRGLVALNAGRFADARQDFEEARDLRTALFGEAHPLLAAVHTNLGNLARAEGNAGAALASHREARAIDTQVLGRSHPRIGVHLHNEAGVLRLLGRFDEAERAYREARQIKRDALGDHPEVARTDNSLGLFFMQRDPDRSREAFERALATYESAGHADASLVRFNLALLANQERRFSEAQALLERVLPADEARFGTRSHRAAEALYALAIAQQGLEQEFAARVSTTRAREIAIRLNDEELVAKIDRLNQGEAEPADAVNRREPVAPRRSRTEMRGTRRESATMDATPTPMMEVVETTMTVTNAMTANTDTANTDTAMTPTMTTETAREPSMSEGIQAPRRFQGGSGPVYTTGDSWQ